MKKYKFEEIRINAWERWQEKLNRHRQSTELTDDYSESLLCQWQTACTEEVGLHCSFYCSLGDWLNNISDDLTDPRFDRLDSDDYEILFRYYTRVIKLVSEVLEDFVTLHGKVKNLKGKKAMGADFSNTFWGESELSDLSGFINSVTKHKAEGRNLHVCNHHLTIVFADFGAKEEENQIRTDQLNWDNVNNETTILMPSLNYLVDVVEGLHIRLGELLVDDMYRKKVYDNYAGNYDIEADEARTKDA